VKEVIMRFERDRILVGEIEIPVTKRMTAAGSPPSGGE